MAAAPTEDGGLSAGHNASCFGAVCGLLALSGETVRRMFLFVTLRDMISAAVRLNVVGPLRGGALQRQLSRGVASLAARTATLAPDTAYVVAPLHTAVGGVHDRLYSRMFNS